MTYCTELNIQQTVWRRLCLHMSIKNIFCGSSFQCIISERIILQALTITRCMADDPPAPPVFAPVPVLLPPGCCCSSPVFWEVDSWFSLIINVLEHLAQPARRSHWWSNQMHLATFPKFQCIFPKFPVVMTITGWCRPIIQDMDKPWIVMSPAWWNCRYV